MRFHDGNDRSRWKPFPVRRRTSAGDVDRHADGARVPASSRSAAARREPRDLAAPGLLTCPARVGVGRRSTPGCRGPSALRLRRRVCVLRSRRVDFPSSMPELVARPGLLPRGPRRICRVEELPAFRGRRVRCADAARPAPDVTRVRRAICVLELLVSSRLGGSNPRTWWTCSPGSIRGGLPACTVGAPAGRPYLERLPRGGRPGRWSGGPPVSPFTLGRLARLIAASARSASCTSHGKGAGLYGRLAARRGGHRRRHTFHRVTIASAGVRSAYLAMWTRAGPRHPRGRPRLREQAAEAVRSGSRRAERARDHTSDGVDGARVRAQCRPREGARTALALNPAALVLGTVARFDPVKGLETLLEAMARLRQRRPGAVCLVVGDGPESDACAHKRDGWGWGAPWSGPGRSPTPRATSPRSTLRDRVAGRRAAPRVLEAMASSLPVVATRVPGRVDAVVDGVTGSSCPRATPPRWRRLPTRSSPMARDGSGWARPRASTWRESSRRRV